jgi:phage RecT family recombinase
MSEKTHANNGTGSAVSQQATQQPSTGQVVNKSVTPVQNFLNVLPKYETTIAQLLKSKGMAVEEFVITIQNAIKRSPSLALCDSKSLFGAILTSAELGLPVNTHAGFAYLIPYKRSVKQPNGQWSQVNEVQFIPGYQGLREIALRNPNVIDIDSDLVCENDDFEYEKTNEGVTFKHKRKITGDRGKRIAAYATARIKNNNGNVITKTTLVFGDEIEMIKNISPGAKQKGSPWETDSKDPFGWMWRKTALKQLCKELPKLYSDPNLAADLTKAVQVDSKTEAGSVIHANPDGTTTIINAVPSTMNTSDVETIEDTFAEDIIIMDEPNEIQAEAIAKADAKEAKKTNIKSSQPDLGIK